MTSSFFGTILPGVSSVIGGFQEAQGHKYNAKLAKQQAKLVQRDAAYEAKLQEERNSRMLGQGRAAAYASGLELSGSNLDLQAQNAEEAQRDVLAIRYNGEAQATALKNQARLDKAKAKQAKLGGVVGAVTGFIGSDLFGDTPSPGQTPSLFDPYYGSKSPNKYMKKY